MFNVEKIQNTVFVGIYIYKICRNSFHDGVIIVMSSAHRTHFVYPLFFPVVSSYNLAVINAGMKNE